MKRIRVYGMLLAVALSVPGARAEGQATVHASTAQQVRTYLARAQQELRAGQPDAAAADYRAALKLEPSNADARANLGVVAMSTGDWSGAAENLETALKLEPSQSKIQALLGLCQMRLGKIAEARASLASALPKLEDSKLKHEAGMRLLSIDFEAGNLNQASVVLAALNEQYPGDPAIAYASYRIHSELAFQSIESLAMDSPNSAQLHRALAEHMVNNGRVQGAVAEYRKALEISPDVADLHFELGQAILFDSHDESNLAEAEREFGASLRLNPADARSECELAEIEKIRSHADESARHFENALKLNGNAACARAGLAVQWMEQGKEQQALEYLQAALRDDPYNDQYHFQLAALYKRMGRKQDAVVEMDKFTQLRKTKEELQQALHPMAETQ